MKKIILTAAAVLALSFANAQDVKFGVKGGLNIASITNSDNANSLTGFHVGFFAELNVSEKFTLQPEVLYSIQGAKDSGITLNLGYINLPIMAKYYVAKDFSLEFGPQIGFLISAKAKVDGESGNVKDLLKSTDFGLNLGAAYDISKNMTVGLRYNLGLSQVQKDLDPGEPASKNSVFSVSIGYKF